MNKKKVKEFMGREPDVIHLRNPMLSEKWTCSSCSKVFTFTKEVSPPAPCSCGSIFFEK